MLIRDNGLFADSYLPVADLDPRVADAALDALREAGIAAYAKASPGVAGPYLDVHLPFRPSDRLFVDATAASSARTVLAGILPNEYGGWVPVPEDGEPTQVPAELGGVAGSRSTGEPDVDLAWEQIVAGFDAAPADPVPRWPAEEDVDAAGREATDRETGQGAGAEEAASWRGGRVIRRVDAGDGVSSDPAAAEPAESGAPEYDEGHYVPPPPPPLPEVEPITRLAWIGLIGGPAFLLFAAVVGWQLTPTVALVAVAGFVGGFGTLIVRMKERPPTDLGGDDGAVI